MLKAVYFYGATGGALTFLDPVTGATITRLPVTGQKDYVKMRGVIAGSTTPATREFVNIKVGSEGDYHDIQVIAKSDADNLTADLSDVDLADLGDYLVKENSNLSGTAAASGQTVGMLLFEDGEPEIPIPEGRTIFLTTIPTGDQATALATTNLAQPNATKALSVNSRYFLKACTVMPQDMAVQAMILKNSGGQVGPGPFKGRIQYPSCPLVVDGNEAVAALAQVQAATEVTAIWEFVEVPKDDPSLAAGTAVEPGTRGGSLSRPPSGGVGLQVGGGFSAGLKIR